MSERQIHINRAGQQFGPYPEATAREMLAAGQLMATDLAWHDGAEGWKALNEVLGATPASTGAAPPPPPPPTKKTEGGVPKRQVAGAKPKEEPKEGEEDDDPDKIHVTRKGEPIGPYTREKAKEHFIAGTLLPTDWGWHDGMGEDWKPLNEVLDLPVPEGAGTAAGGGGDGPWTIGGCLSEGMAAFKGNMGGAIVFFIVGSIVLSIGAYIPFVFPAVMAGFLYYYIKQGRGEPAAIGDLFSGFKRGYVQLLLLFLIIFPLIGLLSILPGLSVMTFTSAGAIGELAPELEAAASSSDKVEEVKAMLKVVLKIFGSALIALPVMILGATIAFSFTLFSVQLMIDRQMKAFESVIVSARMMKGQWFKVMVFFFLINLISQLGLVLFGIGMLFTFPIAMAAWASCYLKNAATISSEHTAPLGKGLKIGLACACLLPIGSSVAAVMMNMDAFKKIAGSMGVGGDTNSSAAFVGTYLYSAPNLQGRFDLNSLELRPGEVGELVNLTKSEKVPFKWDLNPTNKQEVIMEVIIGEEPLQSRWNLAPDGRLQITYFAGKDIPENERFFAERKEELIGQYVQGAGGAGAGGAGAGGAGAGGAGAGAAKGQLVLKKDLSANWKLRGNNIRGKWYIYHHPGSAKGEVLFTGGQLRFLFTINSDAKPINLKSAARLGFDPATKKVQRVALPPAGQMTYTKSDGGGGQGGGQGGGAPQEPEE